MYILEAIGIYNMGKSFKFSNPWIAFIPVANIYAFGKVAEKYIKSDGTRSVKFSKILLILLIVLIVVSIALIVLAVSAIVIAASISEYGYDVTQNVPLPANLIIFLVFGMLLLIGVTVAYRIVRYVALWRLFSIFDCENATLYLILSIFFSFLAPIFIFVLRNRQPKLFAEYQAENYE